MVRAATEKIKDNQPALTYDSIFNTSFSAKRTVMQSANGVMVIITPYYRPALVPFLVGFNPLIFQCLAQNRLFWYGVAILLILFSILLIHLLEVNDRYVKHITGALLHMALENCDKPAAVYRRRGMLGGR